VSVEEAEAVAAVAHREAANAKEDTEAEAEVDTEESTAKSDTDPMEASDRTDPTKTSARGRSQDPTEEAAAAAPHRDPDMKKSVDTVKRDAPSEEAAEVEPEEAVEDEEELHEGTEPLIAIHKERYQETMKTTIITQQ